MGLDQQARIAWPSPANRDYRSPNLKPYSERGGQMKGEQLQNFVEHRFTLQAPPTGTDGRACSPSTQNSSQPAPGSTGSATDAESAVYFRWAQQAWLRQGRIETSPSSGTGSEEDESDDTSEPSSHDTERERKQRKLWAYRQRTMSWANPLRWTRASFRRRLNPNFVDCLMNWPPLWTSAQTVLGPEVMESWLSRERQLLFCLLDGQRGGAAE